jgi:hypothetical protein
MAYEFKGEMQVEFGFGLPNLTTAQRTGYTPPRDGYKVFDTDLSQEFVYHTGAWNAGADAAALTTLAARVTVNEGDITTIEGVATALDTRVGTAESDIVALEANKVDVAGDTMTGELLLVNSTPSVDAAAASKGYVDSVTGALTNSLDELTDTTITAAADGDFLRHNGVAWVDGAIIAADIPDISATYATFAQGATADTAVQPGDATSLLTNNDAFVDLTTAQTIAGVKTFSNDIRTPSDLVLTDTTNQGTIGMISDSRLALIYDDGFGGSSLELWTDRIEVSAPVINSTSTVGGDVGGTLTTKDYVDSLVGGIDTLAELNDTTITAAADGDFLRHNGVAWVDHILVAADLTDGATTFATFAQGATADTATQPGDNLSTLTNDSAFLDAAAAAVLHYTKTELDAGQLDNRYYTETEADANFVDVAGDTMTGELVLANSTPSTGLAATSKDYVDAAITTGATLALNDLTDVIITTPALAQGVMFDGADWVNRALTAADLSDGATVFATFAQGALADTAVQPGDATSTLTNNDAFVDLTTDQTVAGVKTFSADIMANANLTIAGDLTVSGTTTTVNSTNTDIADSIIALNVGEVGAGVTTPNQSGLEIKRGSLADTFMIWNEATDSFGQAFEDGITEGVVDVATFKAFALAEDVASSSHQETFNTGDWNVGSPNTYVVTAATHGIAYSANEVFIVQVYESNGSLVTIDTVVNQTTGDVTLSTVGATFDGRVIISK